MLGDAGLRDCRVPDLFAEPVAGDVAVGVPPPPGRDVPPGTLRRIIRDAGLSVADFIALL